MSQPEATNATSKGSFLSSIGMAMIALFLKWLRGRVWVVRILRKLKIDLIALDSNFSDYYSEAIVEYEMKRSRLGAELFADPSNKEHFCEAWYSRDRSIILIPASKFIEEMEVGDRWAAAKLLLDTELNIFWQCFDKVASRSLHPAVAQHHNETQKIQQSIEALASSQEERLQLLNIIKNKDQQIENLKLGRYKQLPASKEGVSGIMQDHIAQDDEQYPTQAMQLTEEEKIEEGSNAIAYARTQPHAIDLKEPVITRAQRFRDDIQTYADLMKVQEMIMETDNLCAWLPVNESELSKRMRFELYILVAKMKGNQAKICKEQEKGSVLEIAKMYYHKAKALYE